MSRPSAKCNYFLCLNCEKQGDKAQRWQFCTYCLCTRHARHKHDFGVCVEKVHNWRHLNKLPSLRNYQSTLLSIRARAAKFRKNKQVSYGTKKVDGFILPESATSTRLYNYHFLGEAARLNAQALCSELNAVRVVVLKGDKGAFVQTIKGIMPKDVPMGIAFRRWKGHFPRKRIVLDVVPGSAEKAVDLGTESLSSQRHPPSKTPLTPNGQKRPTEPSKVPRQPPPRPPPLIPWNYWNHPGVQPFLRFFNGHLNRRMDEYYAAKEYDKILAHLRAAQSFVDRGLDTQAQMNEFRALVNKFMGDIQKRSTQGDVYL